MEENHSEAEALGQMPTLAGYADQYGQATNYFAIAHPSLPNYVAIWSGDTQGITSDCSVGSGCQPSGPTVWGQTLAAGETAKAYQESMTVQLPDVEQRRPTWPDTVRGPTSPTRPSRPAVPPMTSRWARPPAATC